MKKILTILLVVVLAFAMVACNNEPAETADSQVQDSSETASDATEDTTSAEKPDIVLTMWGSELPDFQDAFRVMCDNFIEYYADEANITIEIGAQSEQNVAGVVLSDVTAAADVYYGPDDRISDLVDAGALQPVQNVDVVASANGGLEAGSVSAATVNGTLYAYPAMGGNGYFLYYNTDYISAEQADSWTGLLDAASASGKQVTMQLNSGWYLYGFFSGAGFSCSLADDGLSTICDWNDAGGVDVAQAIMDISTNSSFVNLDDASFVTGVQEGTIIAGVNGSWNAATIEAAWGDAYACTKLPTFALNGTETQMGSFDGFKVVCVNPYSENVGWAMRLAEWLTNEENQIYLYEATGGAAVPSNVNAAASEAVQANPVVAALATQSQFATAQSLSVGGNFWAPSETLGMILAQGNPDGASLQDLLDEAAAGIEAPVG